MAANGGKIDSWRGGDQQDRQEYIKAQKEKLGAPLDRLLTMSSKRMPSGHYLKEDVGYLEFNGFEKNRDV